MATSALRTAPNRDAAIQRLLGATGIEVRVRLPLAHFVLDVEVRSTARSLGIFGPSGGGKTSLLETFAGWRTPEAGRIRLGPAPRNLDVLFSVARLRLCSTKQLHQIGRAHV